MRKPTLKRLVLGLVQQTAALLILLAIAAILFNSYLAVDTADGTRVYDLSPLDAETEFEDSVIFHDLFQGAVSDIVQLMVIKGQMETDDRFDPYKQIDITEFASARQGGADCPVTAVYELEDLIKWGKYGVEYTDRIMSMSDFVNYFGSVDQETNFILDSDGQLAYVPDPEQTQEQKEAVAKAIAAIPESQRTDRLEDLAFTYIVKESIQDIRVSREDDGTMTVYFPMLSCRYATVDGEKQLTACADNWVEYMALQNNLALTVNTLAANYEQYQNCNDLYQENAGNLIYAVRMMTGDGVTRTYTNVSAIADNSDNVITDYFSEYRRYLIYYPDSLEFTSNTGMTEGQIYQYLKDYDYPHPDMTHIWIAIDTNYPVQGDAFYNANVVFQRIVPNIWYLIGGGILLAVLWLLVGIYLTVTAGVAYDEEEEPVLYLNGIDHVWIEFMILVFLICVYSAGVGYDYLMSTANRVYVSHSEIQGREMTRLSAYAVFAAYGFSVSAAFNVFWYSLIRRIKSHNMWKDSFLHWIVSSFGKAVHFVISHRNSAISSLIPYNLFLLTNLAGIFGTYLLRTNGVWWLLPAALAVVLDGIVGVLRFKQKAEQIDIVEGIRRIRDGEVDYKLDVSALHGDNREMADAVNNIGEGIRKAVSTSMKDEQMKSDLITNVSHDIKTPLTSIINYVDLLKRLKITEEPAQSYIAVLDSKSQRLKQLTDDLVEASKISSGNIVLNLEKLNFTELLNQAVGEFSDRLEEKKLQVIFDGNDIAGMIYADSRRMWRIIENLFQNICKYALEGTRVYLEMKVENDRVIASLKNISDRPMHLKGEELSERFIRGDASRTTEGSGLGLYIAKNLTKAQHGEFQIQLDGDLFKIVLDFPEYKETELIEETTQNMVEAAAKEE